MKEWEEKMHKMMGEIVVRKVADILLEVLRLRADAGWITTMSLPQTERAVDHNSVLAVLPEMAGIEVKDPRVVEAAVRLLQKEGRIDVDVAVGATSHISYRYGVPVAGQGCVPRQTVR
ncbi:MAG: hypothetical protein Q7S70_00210 [bacterium]|nr:hypothetical protein [bacterium]